MCGFCSHIFGSHFLSVCVLPLVIILICGSSLKDDERIPHICKFVHEKIIKKNIGVPHCYISVWIMEGSEFPLYASSFR